MRRLCVYCGSSVGKRPTYLQAAKELGAELAGRKIGLVYGGSCVGLMKEIADAVLAHGGEAIGVIPQALVTKEVAHKNLTELKIVNSMHERKATMAELSDGFIALPGGLGTLEELFEALTWGQLGLHNKPCALLNIENYYSSLVAFLDYAVREWFVKDIHRSMLLIEDNPGVLLDKIMRYETPQVDKWIGRDDA